MCRSYHLCSQRFFPPCKHRLPCAAQWFINWKRDHVPKRAAPISWLLVRGEVGLACMEKDWAFAFVTLLAFRRFLRPWIFFRLKWMMFPPGRTVLAALRNTKTSGNSDEAVTVQDEILERLFARVKRPSNDRFCCLSSAAYSDRMRLYLEVLQVDFPLPPIR